MTDDFKDSLSSLSAIKQTTNPQRKPTLQLCLTYKHNSEMRCLRHSGRCQTINVCKWGPGRDVMGLAVRRPIGVLDALLPHAPPLGLLTRVSSERWFFARVVRPPAPLTLCLAHGRRVSTSGPRSTSLANAIVPPLQAIFFRLTLIFELLGTFWFQKMGICLFCFIGEKKNNLFVKNTKEAKKSEISGDIFLDSFPAERNQLPGTQKTRLFLPNIQHAVTFLKVSIAPPQMVVPPREST